MKTAFSFLLPICLFLFSCTSSGTEQEQTQEPSSPDEEVKIETANTLTEAEKAVGWELLFDGKTTEGWHNYGKDGVSGWKVENGELIALGEGGGDIVTEKEYKNFELALDWKISPKGNSGIFFHVIEDTSKYGGVEHTGPEYQLLDDEGWGGDLEEWQKTGSNYAMHLAATRPTKPVGEWNRSTILVNGTHVEHWLNGERLLAYELWDQAWLDMKETGKWKDYPKYGLAFMGRIALQDHGNRIWFKNIKIRPL